MISEKRKLVDLTGREQYLLKPEENGMNKECKDNKRIRTGVGVMVFRDGKILLGHRVVSGKDTGGIYQPDSWCLPGGKQEYGETILECAAREVREETGLEIFDARIFGAADDIQPDRHFVTLHVFAQAGEGEPVVTEPDKQDAWEWFSLEALPENLYSPSRKFIRAYIRREQEFSCI